MKRWIPWKFLVKRAARAYGVIDPLTLMARLRRFAQPSEVQEPIELLRAGIVFHARGLVNTRAIQHNLDWVWPFWVEKQFNPADPSFIPRAFSFTHVNLTHRNWTAVGRPGLPLYPIVDPRGLATPLYDGWSIDCWLVGADGRRLFPSRLPEVEQCWELEPDLAVLTRCRGENLDLAVRTWLEWRDDRPLLRLEARGAGEQGSRLVVGLRPYNPEGVQFIEEIAFCPEQDSLLVNGTTGVRFDRPPERVVFSDYQQGDVAQRLDGEGGGKGIACEVGMATAAALFPLAGNGEPVGVSVDLSGDLEEHAPGFVVADRSWPETLAGTARLEVPDERLVFLYDAAVRTLVLLSAGDLVPGPYTYRRFWFRDACLMLNAMLCAGFEERSARVLDGFPGQQKHSGYFRSQEGEWDSNGQVLWIMERFLRLTGRPLPESWLPAVWKGARWIERKRLAGAGGERHAGLLPPGFSAEHFGPNDYYYWDDFWGVAGLRSAAAMARRCGEADRARTFSAAAEDLLGAIWRSLAAIPEKRRLGALPASPYRRLDAGAIGSLVADYPLRLVPPCHPPVERTAVYLLEHSFHAGAFFQDMIHSGLNPYLTLAVAQTLLRCGDPRFSEPVLRVAELASATGHWPEAVHPFTGGGCMGDGQHGWAAAEWVMILRSMFVREEEGELVLGSGLLESWLETRDTLSFGPTVTPWGPVTVRVRKAGGELLLEADAAWRQEPPRLTAAVPGYRRDAVDPAGRPLRLVRERR